MASDLDFVVYAAEQMSSAGEITYRKMFGEYGLYCNGKIFSLICDNCLYIKITDVGRKAAPNLKTAPPYDGAKPYFVIENIDDRDFLTEFVIKTCDELPAPKPKKRK